VPDSLPDEIAVLTEIFAVTHSLERASVLRRPNGFRPGDTVVVFGAGALGIAHAIKATLMGAAQVLVVDYSPLRLAIAARLAGATAVNAGRSAIEAIHTHTRGAGADLVVNATGVPGSFEQAVSVVRDGGTVVEVGAFVDMGAEPFNPASLCGRSLALLGIGGEDLTVYEGTMALMDRHQASIAFAEMITHRFAVGDAPDAMRIALDAEISAKVLITPNG
jgi:L-iditol 2-dehydrogenase